MNWWTEVLDFTYLHHRRCPKTENQRRSINLESVFTLTVSQRALYRLWRQPDSHQQLRLRTGHINRFQSFNSQQRKDPLNPLRMHKSSETSSSFGPSTSETGAPVRSQPATRSLWRRPSEQIVSNCDAMAKSPISSAVRSLQLELKKIQEEPVEGFRVRLLDDENIFVWEVAIFGAPETLYEGGYFKVTYHCVVTLLLAHWTVSNLPFDCETRR